MQFFLPQNAVFYPKNQNKWSISFVWTTFYSNLAKFQVYTTFLAEDISKNVILSNRDLKFTIWRKSQILGNLPSEKIQISKIY